MKTGLVKSNAIVTIEPALPVDRNPAAVYVASLGEGSRTTMRTSLQTIARMVDPTSDWLSFPWPSLRYRHTAAIRSKLAESYSFATANRHIAALRGVLKECWRLGLMPVEDYHRAIDLKQVPGQKAKSAEKGRHLSLGELSALIITCKDGTNLGARDAALLAVGYTCGLRRAEIAALMMEDYEPAENKLTVKKGKGNKERVVYIVGGAKAALDAWLAIRGPVAGAIFLRIHKGDRLTNEPLNNGSISFIFKERAKRAGVKTFSPHDLRRTFAGDMLDAGADIATVQQLMGHSSANTTASYDRRDNRAKLAAANRLHLPY